MPKGPKGQKRPADVIGNAVRVMEIATGQREEECEPEEPKNKAAAELGRKGGKARAESMSAARRKAIAQKAAKKRWGSANADGFAQQMRRHSHHPSLHRP
jgi:hypothetical protein